MPRESFYHYLMTRRNFKSSHPIAQFAKNAFYDESFPKQSRNFNLISKYLEENGSYLPTMVIFDQAWRDYLNHVHP